MSGYIWTIRQVALISTNLGGGGGGGGKQWSLTLYQENFGSGVLIDTYTSAQLIGTNNEVDEESRTENDDTEWALNEQLFNSTHEMFPELTVDLFASRIYHKLRKYVARRQDPNKIAIDAFSITWTNKFFFIFPPFSLLPHII